MSPQPAKKSLPKPKSAATKPTETKLKEAEVPAPRRRGRVIFLSVAGVLIVLAAAGTAYAFTYNNRYLPRTVVGGVAIGGMSQDKATAALEAKGNAFLQQPLTLSYQDKTWQLKPADLGTTLEANNVLDQIWANQKGGDWWTKLKKLFGAPLSTRYADVSVTVFGDMGKQVLQTQVLDTIETAIQETTLTFSTRDVVVVPGKPGEKLNLPVFEDDVAAAYKQNSLQVSLVLSPSDPEVTPAMAEPARQRAIQLLSKPLVAKYGDQSYTVDDATLATWLISDVARDVNGQATGLSLMLTSKYTDTVKDWLLAAERPPTNARLGVDSSGTVSVVQPDKDGQQVDAVQTLHTFLNYLNGTSTSGSVSAVITTEKAAVRADTFAELGLTQLVGSGTTDFVGSPVNRGINIKKGATSINQVLVRPGDTFSTLDTLGPIDTAHGYLNELVIKGNRTVPDAGGGLCQVSTTLFRSVLNAGLPIVERQNHAYRVSYYERGTGPGLDATIFEPAPDFKWKNDYASNLFVQSHVEGTKITFDIYGTKDGRVSTISAPTILDTYPVGDPIYANTDTLPIGTTKIIEHPHAGAKTSVTYTVTRDGKKIGGETFISVYKAWPEQILVGTAPVPTTDGAPPA